MVEDKWLLLASIPVVVFLGISIRRRIGSLNARIEELKREEAAGPVNPYAAMYEVMSDRSAQGTAKPSPLLLKAMGKPVERDETDSQADTGRQRQEDNDG